MKWPNEATLALIDALAPKVTELAFDDFWANGFVGRSGAPQWKARPAAEHNTIPHTLMPDFCRASARLGRCQTVRRSPAPTDFGGWAQGQGRPAQEEGGLLVPLPGLAFPCAAVPGAARPGRVPRGGDRAGAAARSSGERASAAAGPAHPARGAALASVSRPTRGVRFSLSSHFSQIHSRVRMMATTSPPPPLRRRRRNLTPEPIGIDNDDLEKAMACPETLSAMLRAVRVDDKENLMEEVSRVLARCAGALRPALLEAMPGLRGLEVRSCAARRQGRLCHHSCRCCCRQLAGCAEHGAVTDTSRRTAGSADLMRHVSRPPPARRRSSLPSTALRE